ncbi:molybdopterin synthase catalytic subunit [Propionibacterium cyclohexanicum]|uniref:Molybdopterin synthase catalytic subunit n=1 Tax=Propionibacterium cyclohexanicum TaxID=64702 RepID=A0A1H9U124_9ACTN|nr:molybdenum cofactor biosynthesis protein MoaE [Propionibacterium cyclohexanicum]SES03320.1 molybdopterin synthase catalytic subunit [Propionibacterium cyclohexanicum]
MTQPVRSGIAHDPLDVAQICASAQDARCGAVVSFVGVVRNHDAGQRIVAIDYSAHPQAPVILQELAESAVHARGVHRVEAWHRVGHLMVGEAAMVVVVAAEHRAEAFATTSALVDSVKLRLPVWKSQTLEDGSHVWTGLK